MALLQECLKLKQYKIDTWSTREQLLLASAVSRSGDQNWAAVSRIIRQLTIENNRPADWYSTKNCALQYAKLLEQVETPKRKREKLDPMSNETPGELVTKMLTKQRIEELEENIEKERTKYTKLYNEIQLLEAGKLDDQLHQLWDEMKEEQKEEAEAEKKYQEMLKERTEKQIAIQKALKPPINKGQPLQQKSPIKELASPIPEIIKAIPIQEKMETVLQSTEQNIDINKNEPSPLKDIPVSKNEKEITVIKSPPRISTDNPSLLYMPQTADVTEEIRNESNTLKECSHASDITESDIQSVEKIQLENVGEESNSCMSSDNCLEEKESSKTDEKSSDVASNESSPVKSTKLDFKSSSLKEPITKVNDDVYAFESDTESNDKKPLSPFTYVDNDCNELEKFEGFTRTRKRPRYSKDEQDLEDKDKRFKVLKTEDSPSCDTKAEFCDFLKSPKHESPVKKKEEITPKKIFSKEDLDDDASRDSLEIKDILMFKRSDRKRVYGHDDAASPVISESTRSSPASTYFGEDSENEKIHKTWKKAITLLWNDIAAHKNASIFLKPITEDKVPGYHNIVYRPTDLQSIKRNIETGDIRTTQEFHREILLMFLNAKMYNSKEHNIFIMANDMMKDCSETIEEFLNAQEGTKSVETPQKTLRRDIRESSTKRSESGGVKRKRKI